MRSGPVPVAIRGVSKRYGATQALQPLELDIRAGELISLLGPSGCGKTTTLRILAGFIAPDSGVLRFGDRDVTRLPPGRRGLGMVFQAYSLFPHMTVAENVAFGLRMRRVPSADRERSVRHMLETVHLGAFADRLPAQLSGGQQQRVALARALITNPSLLLLDEPMAALDKNLRERMQFEIREMQKRLGITTVLVTHDQEEALTMSDRVAVMSDGMLMQIGAPDEIYTRPRSRFVSAFLGTSNLFDGTVRARADDGVVIVELAVDGTRVAGILPDDAAPPPIGTDVTISVRPEKLRLTAIDAGASTPDGGRLVATLRARIFRGAYEVCELEVAGMSTRVVAYAQALDRRIAGDVAVRLDWSDADAVVLPR